MKKVINHKNPANTKNVMNEDIFRCKKCHNLLTDSSGISINWIGGRRDVRMNIAIFQCGISQRWDVCS